MTDSKLHQVIVADDDVEIAAITTTFADKCGCNVETATNVEQVRQLMKSKKFDLVILDALGGAGVALAQELADEGNEVLWTSAASGAMPAGVNHFLTKPFDLPQLFQKLGEIFGQTAKPDGA